MLACLFVAVRHSNQKSDIFVGFQLEIPFNLVTTTPTPTRLGELSGGTAGLAAEPRRPRGSLCRTLFTNTLHLAVPCLRCSEVTNTCTGRMQQAYNGRSRWSCAASQANLPRAFSHRPAAATAQG